MLDHLIPELLEPGFEDLPRPPPWRRFDPHHPVSIEQVSDMSKTPIRVFVALLACEAFLRAAWRVTFAEPMTAIGPTLAVAGWVYLFVRLGNDRKESHHGR